MPVVDSLLSPNASASTEFVLEILTLNDLLKIRYGLTVCQAIASGEANGLCLSVSGGL
jgi:hypothetical protein